MKSLWLASYAFLLTYPLLICWTSGVKDIYKQIYPPLNESLLNSQDYCDPDSNQTCPLFIAFLSSFGGIYKSNGGIPGVQIALDEINRDSSMLPGYSLHYTLKDSNCSRQVALSSFYTQMFQPPTKLGVIGSGCSVATEATAEVAYYFNLTQLSCFSSSPALSNRNQFRSHFQLLSSDINLANGYFGIIKQFGWRKVAIILQNENLFIQVAIAFTNQLQRSEITYTETLFLTSRGVDSLEDQLFDPEARIFLLLMYPPQAREVLCKAYLNKTYYPRYQFIMPGWYGERWWVGDNATQRYLMEKYQCSVTNREQVLAYSLSVLQDEFLKDYSEIVDSGINGAEFYDDYNRRIDSSEFDLESTMYAQQCYDATWTYARALNKTLTALSSNGLDEQLHRFNPALEPGDSFGPRVFTYMNSSILNLMLKNLADTNFLGLTGNIEFNENGVREVKSVIVEQYRNNASNSSVNENWIKVKVAEIYLNETSNPVFSYVEGYTDSTLWPHGAIPYDGVPVTQITVVHISMSIVYGILTAGGIIFALVCLVFNIYFRNSKLMKLSSRNLNYLIITGAILFYTNLILLVIPVKNPRTFVIRSMVSLWLGEVGYYLCFGTIVMKMMRIWYIFHNAMSTATKKVVHDWILALIVLILVGIVIIILTVFMIVDRDNLVAIHVPDLENNQEVVGMFGIIVQYFIFDIASEAYFYLMISLTSFEVLLQIMALIFALCTKNVKVKGLDDSRYVIVSVYITSIIFIVQFTTFVTLFTSLTALTAVSATGYFIATTAILLLIYIPKMVLMYKDPKGETLFDSMTPRTEITTDRKLSRGSTVNSPTDSSSKNGFNMYGKRWLNRRVTTCGVLSDEQGKKEEESKSKLRKVSSYDTTVCKRKVSAPVLKSSILSSSLDTQRKTSGVSFSEDCIVNRDAFQIDDLSGGKSENGNITLEERRIMNEEPAAHAIQVDTPDAQNSGITLEGSAIQDGIPSKKETTKSDMCHITSDENCIVNEAAIQLRSPISPVLTSSLDRYEASDSNIIMTDEICVVNEATSQA